MQRQNNWRRHGGRAHGGNNRSTSTRGRGRQGGNASKNPLRHQLDSNGPLGRVRGNAMQIVEKYMGLAREATSDGDRVLAESCLQYAEHYQRLLADHQEDYKGNNNDDNMGDGYAPNESRLHNNNGMRMMSRGVVRYLDDEEGEDNGGDSDNQEGDDLPSFLTTRKKAESNTRRKINSEED